MHAALEGTLQLQQTYEWQGLMDLHVIIVIKEVLADVCREM